jgi:formylglycine-generating enzyme required for sulfatase activity
MKIKILLLCVSFFVLVLNACSNSVKKQDISAEIIKQFSPIERIFDVIRDSLGEENWLEVEKNENVKICVDQKVFAWKTVLKSSVLNDSCLVFQAPTLVGVETVDVSFSEADSSHKINLAIGMKYLNFKNEEVLLGFNTCRENQLVGLCKNEDPERLVSVTGTYLVDKYPVTNCEFTQLMWDSIPATSLYRNESLRKDYYEDWLNRKRAYTRNENCITQDTAANTVSLFQAMKYANARSIREGLKPYYIFTPVEEYAERESILSTTQRIVTRRDFTIHDIKYIQVSDDSTSNGYRLPYYNEWMMFARGGDKKNMAPWGDSSGTFEKTKKYARFKTKMVSFETEPVGQLTPNGYGLYDMFGLVQEHVLLKSSLFRGDLGFASCLKGGDYHVSLEDGSDDTLSPYWKWISYGYYEPGHQGYGAGFRLIRNIGNNAKWTKIKTVGKE